MAIFSTDIYVEQDAAREKPSRLARGNVVSGEVEYAVVPYALKGTESAASGGDYINLCVLPKGCIPMPSLSHILRTDTIGTTLTLDIGTTAVPDGWSKTINPVAAIRTEVTSSATAAVWLAPSPLEADAGSGNAVIRAKVVSASGLTAGRTLYFVLAYKRGK